MVATLFVVLPSPHEGGALIVDHQGEKQRIQGAPSGKKLKLIAFGAVGHDSAADMLQPKKSFDSDVLGEFKQCVEVLVFAQRLTIEFNFER